MSDNILYELLNYRNHLSTGNDDNSGNMDIVVEFLNFIIALKNPDNDFLSLTY